MRGVVVNSDVRLVFVGDGLSELVEAVCFDGELVVSVLVSLFFDVDCALGFPRRSASRCKVNI